MSVAIIDYGSGNLHSAAKAFERATRSMEDPQKVMVTRDPEAVYRADRIVLPGVGAFADCRRGLDAVDGMLEAMTEAVRSKARPFFGICVGMQLMATRGKEHVTTDGFNWIAGDVEKITPREENLKIPHMGWNTLDMVREHAVRTDRPRLCDLGAGLGAPLADHRGGCRHHRRRRLRRVAERAQSDVGQRPRERSAAVAIGSPPRLILHVPFAFAILLFCLIHGFATAGEVPIAWCGADAYSCPGTGEPYHGPTPPDLPAANFLEALRGTAANSGSGGS